MPRTLALSHPYPERALAYLALLRSNPKMNVVKKRRGFDWPLDYLLKKILLSSIHTTHTPSVPSVLSPPTTSTKTRFIPLELRASSLVGLL
jgi:hypothetical protein